MKKLLAALAAVVAIAPAGASPALVGTWVSSHDLTMAFAKEHARVEDRTELFLDQMMGRLTVRFDGSSVTYLLPDWDAEIQGTRKRIAGFNEQSKYKVLFSNDTTVVIQGQQPITGKEVVTVYNFVDNNTMWFYQGSADKAIPDLNIREYFVRAK
ncbi:hypothetical protein [Dyella sp. 20L07]|uniref:hypothetical protein n=1 Tax=Dyella sp. 20L07 TaxID=3384240 RepID=UPI003D2878D3